jgi:hypothetical protein
MDQQAPVQYGCRKEKESSLEVRAALLACLALLAFGCARMQAVNECRAMGIRYGYYSGGGASCVDAKLNPTAREMVAAFSRQSCARARAVNSVDPEDACKQASLEAETAAWRAHAAQQPGTPPVELSIDTLMPGFNVRYGTPDLPVSQSQK